MDILKQLEVIAILVAAAEKSSSGMPSGMLMGGMIVLALGAPIYTHMRLAEFSEEMRQLRKEFLSFAGKIAKWADIDD